MQNPWKKLGSKVVYQNPWITVREDAVIRPDGKEGIYGVVDARVATGVVALTPNNEVYLVGQFRYATDRYSWEIIEGGAEAGEDPMQAAKRELREEAGLLAKHWEQLGGQIHLSNCHSSEIAMLYLAKDLTEVEKDPDETEVLELQKLPLQEAYTLLDNGKITDAMSVIALLRLRSLLKQHDL